MPPDGMGPLAQFIEIARRAHDFVARLYEAWSTTSVLRLRTMAFTSARPRSDASQSFSTPISTARSTRSSPPWPSTPPTRFPPAQQEFEPDLPHRAISQQAAQLYAVLQVPSVLSRLVRLPDENDGQRRFVLLEDVIGPRLDALFGGFQVIARVAFRVTRNSDLTIQENEVKSSLLSTIEETLRQRKWGAAVRLEISDRADDGFLAQLLSAPALDLEDRDVYKVPGPVDLTRSWQPVQDRGFPRLEGAAV